MIINYSKADPTGNITILVETPVPRESQSRIAARLMELDNTAEQVGFIEKPERFGSAARLQMMGGEFCGNATLSAAALILSGSHAPLGEEHTVTIEVSGAAEPIGVIIRADGEAAFTGEVPMPLPCSDFDCTFKAEDRSLTLPVLRFPGICHAIVAGGELTRKQAEENIGVWCTRLGTEALGLMFFEKNQGLLQPFVYVAPTDTMVWESSCASGTTAVAAFEARRRGESLSLSLLQPGGTLCAAADYSRGALCSLKLRGGVNILGKYSAEID